MPTVPEGSDRRQRSDPPSWAPIPDPTALTLQLVDREIGHLQELNDLQFRLIERQRVESKVDTEKALAAAFVNQEKAAQVLATFTADQLRALQVQFTTSFEQIRKDIAELKEGAKSDHGRTEGTSAAQANRRQASAGLYAALGVAISLLSLILAVAIFVAAKV